MGVITTPNSRKMEQTTVVLYNSFEEEGVNLMCGRFTLFASEKEIQDEFGLNEPIEGYRKSYNLAPSQQVVSLLYDGERKRAGTLQWGLIPSWAEDKNIGYKMINARSESAHEKPSFKKLMTQNRCLIIADSFYEWQQQDGVKEAQRIQVKDRKLFAFAGLWDKWQKQGETLFTCTILTTDSNPFMRNIHHRMPIVLPKDKEDEWICSTFREPMEAKRFLDTIQYDPFTAYPVSDYVNKVAHNDEKCIQPLAEEDRPIRVQQKSLFDFK